MSAASAAPAPGEVGGAFVRPALQKPEAAAAPTSVPVEEAAAAPTAAPEPTAAPVKPAAEEGREEEDDDCSVKEAVYKDRLQKAAEKRQKRMQQELDELEEIHKSWKNDRQRVDRLFAEGRAHPGDDDWRGLQLAGPPCLPWSTCAEWAEKLAHMERRPHNMRWLERNLKAKMFQKA